MDKRLEMENINQSTKNLLQRIARHLMINASFLNNLGLYHGKMGIVLFFAHYARYTGESLYDEFAGELLDEICDEIYTDLPIDFENGLCGIGWGVEYLLHNNFIEGDSDDILSDIDQKVMEKNLRRMSDFSLSTGLKGISCYIDERINSLSRKSVTIPFDKDYLSDWELTFAIKDILNEKQILFSILEVSPIGDDILSWHLGLEKGCAGHGLKLLLQ